MSISDRFRSWHSQWFTEIWWGVMIGLAVPMAFVQWMKPELHAPSPPWLLAAFGGIGGIIYGIALPYRRAPKMLWLTFPGVVYALIHLAGVRVLLGTVLLASLWCCLAAHAAWLVTALLMRSGRTRKG